MKEQGDCCFVGNGSRIARDCKDVIPFESPRENEITIMLSDGTEIQGMAIRRGTITVITGGGYSGKTTLLDGIESGIYDHVPGDGRE